MIAENIEIAEMICNIMGVKNQIEFVQDRLGHDFRYQIDSDYIRMTQGWKPEYNFFHIGDFRKALR